MLAEDTIYGFIPAEGSTAAADQNLVAGLEQAHRLAAFALAFRKSRRSFVG